MTKENNFKVQSFMYPFLHNTSLLMDTSHSILFCCCNMYTTTLVKKICAVTPIRLPPVLIRAPSVSCLINMAWGAPPVLLNFLNSSVWEPLWPSFLSPAPVIHTCHLSVKKNSCNLFINWYKIKENYVRYVWQNSHTRFDEEIHI